MLVAHVLQAQWRRRAAARFVVAVRRQQGNTAQDTPSILLEDAEMCHVRLVARAGATRAMQRSWRRACQVARLGHVRLVALELQVASLQLEDAEKRHVRPWALKYYAAQLAAAAQAQAQVQAQVDNNYKYKTRTRSAEPQNKTYNPLSLSSSRPRSFLSSISGASSHLPSPSTIAVKDPTSGET